MVRPLPWRAAVVLTVAGALSSLSGRALADGEAPRPVLVDRVVARWTSSEHGLDQQPHAIFARELAFEARLEAMAAGEPVESPVTERYVRAALNRHIAESLLALLPIDPAPSPQVIGERAAAAARVLEARVGGGDKVAIAARKEGVSSAEIDAIHRRSARASLYLDRMILPELAPTKTELLELLASGTTPYTKEPFEKVEDDLRRWATAKRLNDALDTFYQRSRSRVTLSFAKDFALGSQQATALKAVKATKIIRLDPPLPPVSPAPTNTKPSSNDGPATSPPRASSPKPGPVKPPPRQTP